jgi:hypothetical protein
LLIGCRFRQGIPINSQQSKTIQQYKDPEITDRESAGSARNMLAVAAQLDLVSCLLAVIAAVLAVRSLRLDDAIAGRVSALYRSSHVDPPLIRIYASYNWRTRRGRMG